MTIYQLIKRARRYNNAIDSLLESHEGEGRKSNVYWHCVPKLYGEYLTAQYAMDYLANCKEDGESYIDSIDGYCYFITEEIDNAIDALKEIHAPDDFRHMKENLAGTQALLEYLQVIDKYWSGIL